MNIATSIGIPTLSATRWMGSMSETTVRAAQLGRIRIRLSAISRARRRTWSSTWGPAAGRPMSAEWMPRSSIRWSTSIFLSSDGETTEGLCSPSRRVSSFRRTGFGGNQAVPGSGRFQS